MIVRVQTLVSDPYTFSYLRPVVNSVTPNNGSTSGNSVVTILGDNCTRALLALV